MRKEKNIILTLKAQWSLILLFCSFIVGGAAMRIIGIVSRGESFPSLLIFVPLVIIIALYLASIILGILSLKTSRFPLLWIVPSVLLVFYLSYTTVTDFIRMSRSGITTVERLNVIKPGKGLGVSIDRHGEHETQIVAVFYKSPAENSGLKNGDIIISIQDIYVHNSADIVKTLNNLEEPYLEVKVLRNGKEITVPVNR
jgi:membrane-associated protease RseP (regulator of RpoE activity)